MRALGGADEKGCGNDTVGEVVSAGPSADEGMHPGNAFGTASTAADSERVTQAAGGVVTGGVIAAEVGVSTAESFLAVSGDGS